MLYRPSHELHQQRDQASAKIRKAVFGAGRNLGIKPSFYQAVAFQFLQGFAQHLGRYIGYCLAYLVEARRFVDR